MKIVRLLKVKNESDIIEQNLQFYATQGIENIVLDNISTDGTFEICEEALKEGIISKLDRICTDGFERAKILAKLDQMCEQQAPDWVVVADADEFIETPRQGVSLYEGIREEADRGNNLIQLANMEFWMTPEDNQKEGNVLKRMQYYSFFPSQLFRIYKHVRSTSLVRYNNHSPEFPSNHEVHLSDELFILRHYKFRSPEQAVRKIREVVPEKGDKTIGFHYLKFRGDADEFIIPAEKLVCYKGDCRWSFEIKFFGHRMDSEELKSYLGLENDTAIEKWFLERNPYYRNIHEQISRRKEPEKNA